MSEKKELLKKTSFDPQQPVEVIFNKIKVYKEICDITNKTKTDAQLVDIGYIIFNQTKAYRDALKVWNAKPEVTKTYANFQMQMRAEFHTLREVGALTIQDSSINLLTELTAQQKVLLDNLTE